MTGIPSEDPVEDPTAPDMAVSSLDSSTRDVPPNARAAKEKVEQPLVCDNATDRQEAAQGIPCEMASAAERTPPVGLSRHFARKAREVPIDTPYSMTPTLDPPGRVTAGHPPRVLAAIELRMCEIWTRAAGGWDERTRFVELELKRKYGMTATSEEIKSSVMSRAGKKYRKALYMKGRKIALRALNKHTMDVVDDYIWSRTAAKDQGDYKEVRLAAVDHLDRLGVTMKKDAQQQQAQVIIIKGGGNFDVSNLDTPTPEVLATEIIQEDAEGEQL